MRKVLLLTTFTLLWLSAQAQQQPDYQATYLKAKAYFRLGNYSQARDGFKQLLEINEKNAFALYANYFYGISAYQLGDTTNALERFRRVSITHDQWDKSDELNVWYGKLLLEKGDLLKGLKALNGIENKEIREIANRVEANALMSYDSLALLQKGIELNPYDSVLALRLAQVINKQDLVERPVELQEFLIESFQLNKEDLDVIDQEVSQMKETYNVGVMMPFLAEELSTAKGNKANQFILDLYQGIQVAAAELNKNGERIRLFAFDTKRDSATTQRIIDSGDLLEMDLVIGPLYPEPAKLMKAYSEEKKINLVNPMSTNSEVIGSNKYSFLLNSTPETRARIAATYASSNFDNKTATIFYGSGSQDSIFAYSYKKYLEADSFKINWITPVKSALASTEVLRTLTGVFDTDTINTGKVYIANTKKVRVNEGDSLLYARDSIGHIMVATENDKLLVFNILSAVETRRDSVPVLGMESWIDFNQISFEQLERLGVSLIGQNFFDFSSENVANFKSTYKSKFNTLPSQTSYSGYESMRFFGEQLINFGNYFQYGLYNSGYQSGYLYKGFNYSNANDNQYVPILKLVNLDLVILPEEQVLNLETQE